MNRKTDKKGKKEVKKALVFWLESGMMELWKGDHFYDISKIEKGEKERRKKKKKSETEDKRKKIEKKFSSHSR